VNDARADRWRRVEALFHEAGALVPAERAAFLKDACGGDTQLESDVNALLAVVSEAEGFLETNAVSVVPADGPTGTLAGQQIGPYAVKALVGAGGMGEVYRATDTRLGRDVAMKVVHGSASADPARLRRFEQEARAAAALNHPNILAVFDVGTHEGVPYLISELLEGTTLRQLLDDGMLPAEHTRNYATQIASGLAAAHDKKIVHRDVKPANVFVTSDGRVKLLDFGVVKLTERDRFPGARLESTAPGVLVGTAAYMSPEQVRGDAVDHRSDVFSFGAVLYEMVTGSPAFERRTAADTLSAVLNEEPSYECADGTPATGRAIDVARRCLDKAPHARFQSCRDLVSALASDAPGVTPHSPAGSRRALVGAALAMLLIAALGLTAWLAGRSPLATGASNIHSLAVLPLRVISHTPDDDSLADSMTEALITNLAKISALRVVSRPSVMRYKDTQKTLPQIGRELGVDAIVAGSIEREGLRVRISAQLIHAATDGHLWADTYDRDMRNVLLLQDEVARTVAREIRVTLTPEERSRLASARPVDPEAYQAYVKGRYFWDKRTEVSINRSIEYFKQAIDRDPSYAAAYSGLADAYVSLGFSFDVGSLPPHEAIPKAKAAAMRALALDDALAEAHNSLGHMKLHYDWDWPGAETEFRRSLELNPGYAQSHHWYSHFLAASGRLEDSIAEGKRAQELDLLSPTMNLHVGWNALFARRYDEALGEFAKTLELQRDYGLAHSYRGLTFEQQGKYAEALEELHKSARLLEGNVVVAAAIGRVHALAGNRSEARRVLADLRQESTRRFINPFEIALIHVGLGDVDASFEWLETAYRSRSDLLVYLNVDPRLDRVRGDPRFKDLVARVGIPASSSR
jgi:eukaryotic-like serine/threonine-protein kinase